MAARKQQDRLDSTIYSSSFLSFSSFSLFLLLGTIQITIILICRKLGSYFFYPEPQLSSLVSYCFDPRLTRRIRPFNTPAR